MRIRETVFVYTLLVVAGCTNGGEGQGDVAGKQEDAMATPDGWNGTDASGDGAIEGKELAAGWECTTDEDCKGKGEGYACNCFRECVQAECLEDINCGSDNYCDSCSKKCLPRLPACAQCERDEQCEYGARCIDSAVLDGLKVELPQRVCAPWCPLPNGVCVVPNAPKGAFACASVGDPKNGVCIPIEMDCGKVGTKCKTDADCKEPARQKCWDDLHICGCKDSLSCDFGQACHPVTHQCVPGCTSDVECGSGRVCVAALCTDACHKDPDTGKVTGCPEESPMPGKEWDCDDTGHCYVPGMCFGPQDCKEPETYCDVESHECKPGCLIDLDCKAAAKICDTVNQKCVSKPCEGNYQCGCGEVCDLETGQCKPAQGKYCEPCDPQQGENACGDPSVLCIEFKTKDGQSKGAFCMPPCSQDPDNPCPQGWQCQEIKDDQGKSYGRKCVRFCYHKIEGCAVGNPSSGEGGEGSHK